MKLTRWAVSIVEKGKRVVVRDSWREPELGSKSNAMELMREFSKDEKPRVERVLIDIPGIEGKGE